MTYKEKILQVRKEIFGIIKAIVDDIPLKCINCPCRCEYPFCAACLVDIGGDND